MSTSSLHSSISYTELRCAVLQESFPIIKEETAKVKVPTSTPLHDNHSPRAWQSAHQKVRAVLLKILDDAKLVSTGIFSVYVVFIQHFSFAKSALSFLHKQLNFYFTWLLTRQHLHKLT